MLVCNIYYLIDVTDFAKEKTKYFNKVINGFDIKNELLWFHKTIYFMINNILINTKLNFFFVRVVKRILKRNF